MVSIMLFAVCEVVVAIASNSYYCSRDTPMSQL
jgi:hypothetical protein